VISSKELINRKKRREGDERLKVLHFSFFIKKDRVEERREKRMIFILTCLKFE
jgi:hypothetical protein